MSRALSLPTGMEGMGTLYVEYCYKNSGHSATTVHTACISDPWGSSMSESFPCKWRHCAPESIVCGVRWYLRYSLSYRDVEKLFLERELSRSCLHVRLRSHLRLLSRSSGSVSVSCY